MRGEVSAGGAFVGKGTVLMTFLATTTNTHACTRFKRAYLVNISLSARLSRSPSVFTSTVTTPENTHESQNNLNADCHTGTTVNSIEHRVYLGHGAGNKQQRQKRA